MRRLAACAMAAILLAQISHPAMAAQDAGAEAGGATTVPGMVAVPPPLITLSGRVMLKDGVTPVAGAEVLLTGGVDGEPRAVRSDRSGRYKVKTPAGQYRLQITHRMEIYKAPAVFRVPASGGIEIDFLLLRDFEPEEERSSITSGPDPLPSAPVVVGSVVDMVHSKSTRRWGRWAEALGFLGGLLAVAVAAN